MMQTPNTPSTAMSHLAIQTPPRTPCLHLPLHARARAFLRATCNSNANIAGRGVERGIIRGFVTAFFSTNLRREDLDHPVLYISGSPGCGKTALINSVLTDLEVEIFEHGVNVTLINCMALNGLDAVWERLVEELGGSRVRGKKMSNCDLVQSLLARRKSKCILVLDEMDHVATCSKSLIALFSLAQKHAHTLRIIGIANTHSLTSSSSQFSMNGVTGVKTVHFAPYEPAQLLEIVQARLQPLSEQDTTATEELIKKFLPVATLTLLTKKIAARTGDVRAVFEVLRSAIDLAVVGCSAFTGSSDYVPPTVTPSHILAALKAYAPSSKIGAVPVTPASSKTSSNSEIVAKVRNLGLQSRLVLLALLLACKRLEAGLSISGSNPSPPLTPPRSPTKRSNSSNSLSRVSALPTPGTSIDTAHLHSFYTTIVTREGSGVFAPVSRCEFFDLAGMLETVGLISLSSSAGASCTKGRKLTRTASFGGAAGKGVTGQDVKFMEGIRADEVLRGLGIDLDCQASPEGADDIREEEVRVIWQREMAKVKRESKSQQNKMNTLGNVGFDGAMED
ncbi:hypothetical protein EW146_g4073 [Bondarzewia mesenterica]|uniref:AAA+ ATPase domain-containing protein n=1 Tax=Bondarzewia mesenterica TaxID=1095465 RepID=A0A4S4LVJ3_9AGAM|nr:hypothetical protein EW146_g4073 [Bondarzewia mesenterica]